jgi:O-antigen ligase
MKKNTLLYELFLIIYLIWLYFKPLIDLKINNNFLVSYIGRIIIIILFLLLFFEKNFLFKLLKDKSTYIFLFLVILSSIFSAYFSQINNLNYLIEYLYNFISCWFIYELFKYILLEKSSSKFIIISLAALALLNTLVALYFGFSGQKLFSATEEEVGYVAFGYDMSTGRIGGIRGENYTGIWNAPLMIYGILLAKNKNLLKKFLGYLFIIISLLSAMASLSRTSFLGIIFIIFSGIYIFYFKSKTNFLSHILLLIVFVFTIKLAFSFQYKIIEYAPENIRPEIYKRIILSSWLENDRLSIWRYYVNSFIEMPFFGKGPGYISEKYKQGFFVPHNSLLDIAVETGIFGLCIYIYFFLRAIRAYLRRFAIVEDYANIFFILLMTILLGLQFLSNPFFKLLWIALAGLEASISYPSSGLFRSDRLNEWKKIQFMLKMKSV